MTIGQRIKQARKNAGLTQRELAEKSGTATGTIQQYELGKRQPRTEQLQRIAAALNVSAGFLLDGRERKKAGKMLVEKVWKSDKASRLYMCIDSTLLGDLDAIAKVDNMSLEDEIEEILYWEVENRHEKWEDEESSRMMQEWYNAHHADTQDAIPVPGTIGQELDSAEQKSVEKQKQPTPVTEDGLEEIEAYGEMAKNLAMQQFLSEEKPDAQASSVKESDAG